MMFIKKYITLIVLACVMLAISIAAVIHEVTNQKMIFELLSFCDIQYQLEIEPYYDEQTDKYYLFLPSYTDKEKMVAECKYNTPFRFSVNGQEYENICDIPLETDVLITVDGAVPSEGVTLQILQCENLPTVYVKTKSGTMDAVNFDKKNEEDTVVMILDSDGELECLTEAKISGRGNGTWENEKKPYNLNFKNNISFGRFESVSKLCLLTEFLDESKMRNAVAYFAAYQQNIPYSSQYEYCELYIDGEFYGLYGAVTKEEYTHHIETDGISAVFEIASSESENEFFTETRKRINVIYGDLESVKERVDQLETALKEQNWELCRQYIDVDSFAQKYAFEEWISNYDLIYASQYFYIDNDGLIRCMLPWDYDWSLGSVVEFFNDIQSSEILANRRKTCWYTQLSEWDSFRNTVVDRLKNDYTEEYIDSLSEYAFAIGQKIEVDRELDGVRWCNADAPAYVTSEMVTPTEFAEYFGEFLLSRKDFLIRYFTDPAEFCCVEMVYDGISRYLNVCIPVGDSIHDYLENSNYFKLCNGDENFLGFYTEDGLDLNDVDTVTEDMIFYAQLKDGGASNKNSSSKSEEPEKNPFVKMMGFPNENYDHQNVSIAIIFGAVFLVAVIFEIINGARRRRGDE